MNLKPGFLAIMVKYVKAIIPRRAQIAWLMILCFSQPLLSQQHSDKNMQRMFVDYEQALMDGVAIGDKALWSKRLHDSCIIVTEEGKRLTKAKMIQDLNPLPTGYVGRIKVIEPKLQRYGNTVVLTFVADEYLDLYNQHIHTQYRQTDTWQFIKREWKLVAMQTFEIPKNPPPVAVDSAVLKRYAGIYQLSPERKATVYVQDGRLMVKKGERVTELQAETENVFFRVGDGRVTVIFLSVTGGGYKMVERREGEDLTWTKANGANTN